MHIGPYSPLPYQEVERPFSITMNNGALAFFKIDNING
jgi:hypothetical protein